MKIGHITYRYKPMVGGAETYLANLFKVFDSAGYNQRVYQTKTGVDEPGIIEVERISHKIPKLVDFNLGLLKFARSIAKEDKLVVNYPEHFFPVFWHRGAVVLSHGATWTHETNKIRRWLRRFSAAISIKLAPRFVANDTFVLRELGIDVAPEEGFFKEVKKGIWFIPNCVDTQVFVKNNGIREIKEQNSILIPRNLTYPRGVDLAIRAFQKFSAKHPEANLIIVGDSINDNMASVDYKQNLFRLVKDLNIESKVHFIGSFPWLKMPDLYSSVRMTLIPTRFSEGTSLSALESMSCGVATLTTDVEGLLDLPGIKCRVDIEDMAAKMELVYCNHTGIGTEQQQIVQRVFNLNNWGDAWLRVIQS